MDIDPEKNQCLHTVNYHIIHYTRHSRIKFSKGQPLH
jgi:hypothetical protein